MLKHSVRLADHCFQIEYIEIHSNYQTFNVGRAYYCQLIHFNNNDSYIAVLLFITVLFSLLLKKVYIVYALLNLGEIKNIYNYTNLR